MWVCSAHTRKSHDNVVELLPAAANHRIFEVAGFSVCLFVIYLYVVVRHKCDCAGDITAPFQLVSPKAYVEDRTWLCRSMYVLCTTDIIMQICIMHFKLLFFAVYVCGCCGKHAKHELTTFKMG